MTLSRINSRIWKSHSEKFIDYAEDKLKLMQFLNLSEKEKIELLADGVRDPFLRRFALGTGASSVPNFITHIRKITEDSVLVRQQTSDLNARTNAKQVAQEMLCSHCKKRGHLVKDC
jgi:type IV secretory pathway TrbF-like protein